MNWFEKNYGWLILVAIVLFYGFLNPLNGSWEGDGVISVFPEDATVKNYRLDAYMEVEKDKSGWFGAKTLTYTNIIGSWPNGGTLDLYDCTVVNEERAFCRAWDGDGYYVEVYESPPEPEYEGYEY